uniref:Uncharacterized protein n=1 Tax=Populus trichocarpa TaxID=3694 RepID=U5FFW8_POPTR
MKTLKQFQIHFIISNSSRTVSTFLAFYLFYNHGLLKNTRKSFASSLPQNTNHKLHTWPPFYYKTIMFC